MSIPEDPSMAASSAFEKVTVPAGLSTPVATPEALEGTPGVAEGAEGAEVGTGDALPPFEFDSGAFAGVERSFGIWNVLSDEEPGPAFVPGVTFFSAGDANDAVAPSLSFSFAAASLASYGSTNPTPFFTEWSQPMKLEVNAGGSRPD
jgi:hypothetical protein